VQDALTEREKGIIAFNKMPQASADVGVQAALPPANGENPTHREDFMRLVGAAARKPEPKD